MTNKEIISSIVTLGNVGYYYFSGTCATFITGSFIFILRRNGFLNNYYYTFIGTILLTHIAFFVINSAQKYFHHKDPSQIVLDEVIASLWIFLFIPLTFSYFFSAFIFFRFFDGTKFGIAWTEKFKGAWGIMIDDLAAATLTHIFLYLLITGLPL
jgi:phosphatidylglycerophosphatase A